ncbi:MAG TPA: hypothetical protein ENN29_12060 [Candidatus Hydrogenedentes bacterium]|nr:hypothetical protein [Candidatus Hydrogenedentota bacterium]
MPHTSENTESLPANALFVDFVRLLRDYGVPVGLRELLELNQGFEKGVVADLDSLFIFSRLVFVKRVEHADAFERAFALYFYDIDIPAAEEGDYALFSTDQFRRWLEKEVRAGRLPNHALWEFAPEELMKRFWDTLRKQMEEHHGGSRWIGTGGNSPFGHSGNAARGMRVMGASRNRAALKVIGERRYIAYSDKNRLREENLRQALETMKHLKNEGPYNLLNLDATIRNTARNGGEIDLVFERDLRDKISVVLLIDNGGYSMTPFVEITRLLFAKMHERFEDMATLFFHNTIYERVWRDFRRTRPLPTEQLLLRKPDTRLVIVGDATMAPEELEARGGAIDNYRDFTRPPSLYWLKRLSERFPHACWLNPLPRDAWEHTHGAYTLKRIRALFHMEDMTLGGVKGMVERLSEK